MDQFYGYQCYDSDGNPLGWFYTTNSGRVYNYTNNAELLHWAKRWKTPEGGKAKIEHYNKNWHFFSKGGSLKIEAMPEFEIPVTSSALKRKEWDLANKDIVKQSKAEYDRKNPIISFRPTPELIQWLEEERWDDDGKPETDGALIRRKLEKLMKLESQGY
jgi:hypothetical protein